jgi:molybdate transport system regulatory protein
LTSVIPRYILRLNIQYKNQKAKDEVEQTEFSVKGRVWIEQNGETFLGYGRVVLLERIKEHGSITKAAKSMGMSYRHAWELVESINKGAGKNLVETAVGGNGGGGSIITPAGENAVNMFRNLHKNFKDYLQEKQQDSGKALLG